jgi:hypothetical protein
MRFAATSSDDTVISFNLSELAREGRDWIAGDVCFWIGDDAHRAHYDVRLKGEAPQDTPPADAPAPEAKTLRDEFAMAALKTMLGDSDYFELSPDQMAVKAYRQADAMMEARKK